MSLTVGTHNAEQTRALGARLARAIKAANLDEPLIVALNGELGAGKTTFVNGFLRELGVVGAVRSPTYTLIEAYELHDLLVYHLDLYRLANAKELEMLAPRDLLTQSAVLLIEWAERGADALPPPDLTITLGYQKHSAASAPSVHNKEGAQADERHLAIEWESSVGKELARSLDGDPNEASVSS